MAGVLRKWRITRGGSHEPDPRHSAWLLAAPHDRRTRGRLLRRAERRGFHAPRGHGLPPPSRARGTATIMAAGRSRPRNPAPRAGGPRRGRGLVMFHKPLPRFVIAKRLASGLTGFYFHLPATYRKLGCTLPNEALGTEYVSGCG